MAAPGAGSVLVSIGISTGTGLGQDLPRFGLTCPGPTWSGTWTCWSLSLAWGLVRWPRLECFEQFDAAAAELRGWGWAEDGREQTSQPGRKKEWTGQEGVAGLCCKTGNAGHAQYMKAAPIAGALLCSRK